MPSHLYRFGILRCAGCFGSHEFVSYSGECKHITDAFCSECGYTFGRFDRWDEMAFRRVGGDGRAPEGVNTKGAPVISDRVALEAVARLIARETKRPFEDVLRDGGTIPDAAKHAVALLPPAPLHPEDRGVHAAPLSPELAAPDGAASSPAPAGASLRSPPAGASAGRVPGFAGPRPAGQEVSRSRGEEFMRDFASRNGRA